MPRIAVVSRSLTFDWRRRCSPTPRRDARPLVVTCAAADPERRAEAAEVADVVAGRDERVESPPAPRRRWRELGADVVLTEGGPSLLGELIAAGALDELCLTIGRCWAATPCRWRSCPSGTGLVRMRLGHALLHDDALFLRYERAAA